MVFHPEAERERHFEKLGLSRSYGSLFCEWLGRSHLLLSLTATLVVSFASAFSGEMGLLPCAASPWAILIGGCAGPFGVLAVVLILRAGIPTLCNAGSLVPAARVVLVLTAVGSWAVLPFGSSAMVVMTGSDLPGTLLSDLRAQCPPDPIGLSCWEHRCGGVTRVFLSEGKVLQEYARLVRVGPYKMWVVPVTQHRGQPQLSQLAREEIEAFGVQWWSEPPLYWASEPFRQSKALCNGNGTEAGICATLLWGNVGPVVRAIEQAFPGHPIRPVLALGDPEQFVDAGRPYLLIGFALLAVHSALIFLLVCCVESRTLREGNWRKGGYGRLGAFPSPPAAEVHLYE
mmetsp:Transcript_46595/g.123056  ORF Transcript_46595/g.123056 Transcript_46595/m.123056 type:complete len:344 (+) Transcript_46595:254-1285(+)